MANMLEMNKDKEIVANLREYLDFISKAESTLLINRQIYHDFHKALIEQKANWNLFIKWTVRNYYQVLILDICKLLEANKSSKHDDGRTIPGFLELCKQHWQTLRNERLRATGTNISLSETNFLEKALLKEKQKMFDNINIGTDLTKIKLLHEKIKRYRNKKIAHLTISNVDNDNLEFDELHKIIDKIDSLISKYYHLFGVSIDDSSLKTPYCYNFTMSLK
ncbi:MAG: hypothetical protein K5780_05160 [Alphaproteobacteria bacterium]|nr:hypothetical protein [Alphaproteobacteria bacterium]